MSKTITEEMEDERMSKEVTKDMERLYLHWLANSRFWAKINEQKQLNQQKVLEREKIEQLLELYLKLSPENQKLALDYMFESFYNQKASRLRKEYNATVEPLEAEVKARTAPLRDKMFNELEELKKSRPV